jgi:hypothetical protein
MPTDFHVLCRIMLGVMHMTVPFWRIGGAPGKTTSHVTGVDFRWFGITDFNGVFNIDQEIQDFEKFR